MARVMPRLHAHTDAATISAASSAFEPTPAESARETLSPMAVMPHTRKRSDAPKPHRDDLRPRRQNTPPPPNTASPAVRRMRQQDECDQERREHLASLGMRFRRTRVAAVHIAKTGTRINSDRLRSSLVKPAMGTASAALNCCA